MPKIIITLCAVLLLTGCAASTPLILAGGGGQKILHDKETIRFKAAAALHEEGDLLTYSVKAIAEDRTEDVVNTYLKGYTDPKYSQAIKSLAIYQIGLIYMNPLNEHRDDKKALLYFKRHQIEFPGSLLEGRINKRITLIEKRKSETVQLTPNQVLHSLDKDKLLARPSVAYDDELTPMSERAISDERILDAESVYMVVYSNPGSSEIVKAKALYQLGLIYMSPYNHAGSTSKAVRYFRKITDEFPGTKIARKAQHKISDLHNRQLSQPVE